MKKTLLVSAMTVGFTLVLLLGLGSPAPVKVNAPGGTEEPADRETNEAPPADPVQLHISLSVAPHALSAIKEATDMFMLRYPHIEVRFENVPEQQAFANYSESTSLGTAPDVMLLNCAWIRSFASEGRLRALDDVISMEQQNRWFDSVLQAARWNGYIWAVPLNWDPYVIVYDSSALDVNSVTSGVPAAVSDWVKSAGVPALNRSDEQSYKLIAEGLRESEGLEAGDKETGGAAPSTDAIGLLTNAWEGGAQGPQQAIEALLRGEAGWTVLRLSEALQNANAGEGKDSRLMLTYVPPPADGKERMTPPHGGQSLAVSPVTRHPEEAASWISFITDRFVQPEGDNESSLFSVFKTAYDVPPIPTAAGSAEDTRYGYPLYSVTKSNIGSLLTAIDSSHANYETASAQPAVSVLSQEESSLSP